MTVKELYKWAVENGYEHFDIWGLIDKDQIDINKKEREIVLDIVD